MLDKLGTIHPLLPPAAGLLALLTAAIIIDLIAKQIMVRTVRAVAKRSSVTWDDALVEHNVFGRLVQVVPALIIYIGVPFVPGLPEGGSQLIHNIALGYMVLMLTMQRRKHDLLGDTYREEPTAKRFRAAPANRRLDPGWCANRCDGYGPISAVAAQRFRRDDRYLVVGVQRHDPVVGCQRTTYRAGHGSRGRLD
jgi:hypothetical protein